MIERVVARGRVRRGRQSARHLVVEERERLASRGLFGPVRVGKRRTFDG